MTFHDELNSLYLKAIIATEHEREVVMAATQAILIDLAKKGVSSVTEEALKGGVKYHDATGEVRSFAFENAFFHAISDLKDMGLKFRVRMADNAVFYSWA